MKENTIENRIKRDIREFEICLRKFGFKKIDTSDYQQKGCICYQNEKQGWFADFIINKCFVEVWLVGNGLKCGGFPGGWNYGSAELITKELNKALKNKQC